MEVVLVMVVAAWRWQCGDGNDSVVGIHDNFNVCFSEPGN